jgi:hypothetical protein
MGKKRLKVVLSGCSVEERKHNVHYALEHGVQEELGGNLHETRYGVRGIEVSSSGCTYWTEVLGLIM